MSKNGAHYLLDRKAKVQHRTEHEYQQATEGEVSIRQSSQNRKRPLMLDS
jgi:hypothetical protein